MRALLAACVVAGSLAPAVACPIRLTVDVRPAPAEIAIAFVINGQEVAMGNDSFETDEAVTFLGMLPTLRASFDADFLRRFSPQTNLAVITYADRAQVRVPMRRLKFFSGMEAFGTQRDYYSKIGTDLVGGVEQGLAQLGGVTAGQKYLVVIGDGNDTNNEAAKEQLARLRKQALDAGVTPIAVIYKSPLSDESNVVTSLDQRAERVYTIDAIWPQVWSRIQLTRALETNEMIARSFAPTTATATESCCLSNTRVQLGIGSILALLLMSGAWFIRRERPGIGR